MSKTRIIVIKFNGKNLGESKPCKYCINLIKNMGIKTIMYSNSLGIFITEKSSEIVNDHVSKIRKLTSKI